MSDKNNNLSEIISGILTAQGSLTTFAEKTNLTESDTSGFKTNLNVLSTLLLDMNQNGNPCVAMHNILSLYSPAFQGTPTAPTPSGGSNDNQIATTQFVMNEINNSTITLTQNGVPIGSFTLNQLSGTSIQLNNAEAGQYTSFATLSGIANNGYLEPDHHYSMTMTANTTLNARGGLAGRTCASELFINPKSYTFTAGTNLTLVNALNANKINHCTLSWYGTACRMYVIDSWQE